MRLFGLCLLLVCALCACTEQVAPAASGELPREECRQRSDGLYCHDDEALRCRAGEVAESDDCAEQGKICVPSTGCMVCAPASYGCDGNALLRCAADGTAYVEREICAEGLSCSREGCVDLCQRAERERSYIGCEYYPVFPINNQLDAKFKPAVVIANPNLVSAEVSISRGATLVAQVEVAPGAVQTVMLEFLDALRSAAHSAIVRDGAYHLVSSVPVTVHQFNPLLFEVDEDCARDETDGAPGDFGDKKCNSYSNDASLLLPSHALVRDSGQSLTYLANTRASFLVSEKPEGPYLFPSPGFIAVVATGDRPVHVKVTSSAFTIGSPNYVAPRPDAGQPDAARPDADASTADAGMEPPEEPEPDPPSDAVAPLTPGGRLETVTLLPGDVLQLLSDSPSDCADTPIATRRDFVCPLGADFDLTGSSIEADGPIEVIAGHNCSYVPLDRVACDHLEETMFPLDTWGVEVIAARPRGSAVLPHVLRVLSGADDNLVSFSPDRVQAPVTLARGQSLELLTTEHVVVSAQKPISVAQYLVGQNGQGTVGDPSMSIAIPVEQYRSSYAFLSPATYSVNYVTIIAQAGDAVVLDGLPVDGFVPVADGAYQAAAIPLTLSGAHEVHSALGLGIGVVVYGYGDYTSYMLPGGLDLRPINVLF